MYRYVHVKQFTDMGTNYFLKSIGMNSNFNKTSSMLLTVNLFTLYFKLEKEKENNKCKFL